MLLPSKPYGVARRAPPKRMISLHDVNAEHKGCDCGLQKTLSLHDVNAGSIRVVIGRLH